jgi:predicted DNA binding CopG/RHH family protein
MRARRLKEIPRFKSEAEERAFWLKHDTTGYFPSGAEGEVRFPNLKPSTQSISLRLPVHLLESIKVAANKRDIPYQSLIKVWLEEKAKSS